jgi:hypothetical protein
VNELYASNRLNQILQNLTLLFPTFTLKAIFRATFHLIVEPVY